MQFLLHRKIVAWVFWVVFRALVVSKVLWVLVSSVLYDILVSENSLGHFLMYFSLIYTHNCIINLYSSNVNHES